MDRAEIFKLHIAQSENVCYLKKVFPHIRSNINAEIRRDDTFQVDFYKKSYTLLYSAWSEVQFIQIACTPDGFMHSEIRKIMRKNETSGISNDWREMISLTIKKVGNTSENKDLRKRLNYIQKLVQGQI